MSRFLIYFLLLILTPLWAIFLDQVESPISLLFVLAVTCGLWILFGIEFGKRIILETLEKKKKK